MIRVKQRPVAKWPQSPFADAAVDQDQSVFASDEKAENPGLHLICWIGVELLPPLGGRSQRDEAGGGVAPCGVLNRDDFDASYLQGGHGETLVTDRLLNARNSEYEVSSIRCHEVRNCRLGRSLGAGVSMTIPRVDEPRYINGAWRCASRQSIDLFDPMDAHVIAGANAHHAGYLEDGIGGEHGKWGLTRYTQVKAVYHHYGE